MENLLDLCIPFFLTTKFGITIQQLVGGKNDWRQGVAQSERTAFSEDFADFTQQLKIVVAKLKYWKFSYLEVQIRVIISYEMN